MKYTTNAVYTRIETAIKTAHPTAFVSSRVETSPKSYPAVGLTEIRRSRPLQGVTLDHTDDFRISTFEAQIFSNKKDTSRSEAYSVLETVEEAFKSLGYIEIYAQPVLNVDPTIYRIVARFQRYTGGGDEMPLT